MDSEPLNPDENRGSIPEGNDLFLEANAGYKVKGAILIEYRDLKRKVANGIPTRWCTRHTRLAASCDFWPGADLNCNDSTVDAILILPLTARLGGS